MVLSRRSFLTAAAVTLAAPAIAQRAPLKVVATTGMIADTARRIGGDAVEVTALMGPGVDPHSYRQTRTDIVAMTRADMVLRNGLHLEAQMADFFDQLSSRLPVVPVAEAVPGERRLSKAGFAGFHDPHVWMDPDLWSYAARAMEVAFNEAGLDTRTAAETFSAELKSLSDYARPAMATVPDQARVLVTAHDAFGYFGRAFGLEVVGIQGISTESEAGLNRIGTLVDLLVTRGVRAVFVESSVSDRNIRALIEGAAASGHEVVIGGELFSDAMGQPGTYEGTYPGMIDHNITTIARALGGEVPERGLAGQLTGGAG